MNINLRTHALRRAISCRNLLAGLRIAVSLAAAALALPASSRTVYDAGKAFNEAGHNKNAFGVWSLLHASGEGMTNTKAFDATAGASGSFAGIGGGSSPWIRVNTGSASIESGEEVLPNELLIHPADPKGGTESYPSDVVRFTAPEAGWYSANIFAHDTAKEANNASTTNSGVQVSVRAQGKVLVRQIVSLEDYAANNPTHCFDFQMPVRYLAAGDKIEVVVGNKYNAWSAHGSDMTGLRFTVTKEDEGAFYDSGIALTNNIATTYANPYGNIKDGTWYYLLASVPAGTDFTNWAPANFNNALTSRISTQATRSDASSQRGFAGAASGTSPYVLVNETAACSTASTSSSSQSSQIAPCELHVHPKASDLNAWPVIRFRPPVSGYYSASIVARDVIRGKSTDTPTPDGVHVYLLVSGTVVTNVYISAETFSSTAHLTFEPRLLAANEPVDVAVFANASASSDATGISAIFRRENGAIYDAGKSFFADHAAGGRTDSFADLLGGGATWQLGAKTNAWCGSQFFTGLTSGDVASGSKTKWWLQGRFQNFTEFPYFLMITNGVASADGSFDINADLFAVSPYEFAARPNDPGYQSSSPTIKATVPADGVYRVRSCVRDLNHGGGEAGKGGDGIRASVVANGYIADSAVVWRLPSGGGLYETVLSSDRLWLKSGDRIEYVIDPQESKNEDPTGLTACYEIEDASPSAHVINIDVTGSSGNGRFSSTTATAREGWGDWIRWNAIRFSSSLPQTSSRTIENCREADGVTKGNVSFTITRDSGSNIQKGSGNGPTGLHNIWVASESASDTYTLTLSRLKANEPYTLWLYSAKGGAEGNASFTVGGVTKGVEEPWSLGATNMVTRFDATSDANGQITGTFAAADANGGAFNGLSVVGEFPDYIPEAFVISLR